MLLKHIEHNLQKTCRDMNRVQWIWFKGLRSLASSSDAIWQMVLGLHMTRLWLVPDSGKPLPVPNWPENIKFHSHMYLMKFAFFSYQLLVGYWILGSKLGRTVCFVIFTASKIGLLKMRITKNENQAFAGFGIKTIIHISRGLFQKRQIATIAAIPMAHAHN